MPTALAPIHARSFEELPHLLTIAAASDYLSTSEKTVRRMIARGDLQAVRVGPRLLRIRRASLEALGR